MRIKIVNRSSRPDDVIVPLVEFAAKFFPHRSGQVSVVIKNTRDGLYGHRPHGKCYGGARCIVWVEPPGHEYTYPKTFDQMHYFRHANHEDVKPLTANNWMEYCLNVIAHELEHTTKGNLRMRRSRQEIHSWNRGVEVVEAFRSEDGLKFFYDRQREIKVSQEHKIIKGNFKKSPEYKRQACEKLLEKWTRKQKLAQTKIRKLKTRIKYFEKRELAAASKGATT